jgi:hypothetical protein
MLHPRGYEARGGRGVGTVKKDWAAAILERTLFPRAEDIPQSLAMVFMRMMMAHAKFESQVRALQSTVANDLNYGELPRNRWRANERPTLMVELIEEKLGQIPGAMPNLLNHLAAPSCTRLGSYWGCGVHYVEPIEGAR